MPINHWRGPCRFCGRKVGRKKGFASKSTATGVWVVWHGRCDPLGPPGRPAGRAGAFERKPSADPPKPYYADRDDD